MFESLKEVFSMGAPSHTSSSSTGHHHISISSLSKGQHSASDVAMMVIEYASRREPDLSLRQRKALAWYRSGELSKTLSTRRDNDKIVFNAYFHFFDDMFFGSLLKKGRISVYLTKKETRILKVAGESSTYCRKTQGRTKTSCIIWVHRATHIKDNRDQGLFGLSTLLHEMLRCFLDSYTCLTPSCRDGLSQLGKEHGFAWQDAAYALEKAVNDPTYLNLPLMLERSFELVSELKKWGKFPVKDLGRWGFTNKELKFQHGRWDIGKRDSKE
ncbi:uncharacterized protein PAC_18594 [Phialocephala subalpina]|uniref:Uncharacterized protein n=1 Tax=Phialocephala subalpina TaxID=576137 RepID=A0A1L7XUK2_9HELO|nr:uncharacterized protein PAC_18594 [Phialocephala subalpina]